MSFTMFDANNIAVPRRAAAGILVSGSGPDLEVLLARRNTALRFMGGHHVFPGGSIQDDDDPGFVDGAPAADSAKAIFAVAREVFEETGLLCVPDAPPPETLRPLRMALVKGLIPFSAILERIGRRIHGPDFTPAGIWVTPKWSPMRFYTRYFIYRHEGPRYEEVIEPEGEILGLDWLRPAEARARWHAHELKLSTPVAFVLRFLAGLPLDQALPWLHDSPHRGEEPCLYEPRRGLHIIPLRTRTLPPANRTNCTVIGEEALCVIDPGATDPDEQRHLREQLDGLCALGGRVALVLLTHGHRDHAGAAAFLHETYGAPVWGHAALAGRVDAPIARTLGDGEVFDAGGGAWRIRVLHTPGHDPAHLCYFEETTASLMAGDMLANPGTVLVSPEMGGDMNVYLGQLERLAGVDFHFLIPGHGLPMTGEGGRQKLRGLIAHRLMREEKVRAALDAGHRSMEALLEEVYSDTPRELWPLATQQLQAHLVRLGVAPEDLD